MEVKKWLLGEVLENYDYLRKPLSSMQRETFKGEYPYYGAQGIIDYVAEYRCDGEYLLIAEDGENLSSRNVPIAQIAKGKYWVNNHAHVVRNNENADLRYICYLLNNSDIAGYVTGSAQPKLSQGNLNKIKIALPTLPTQQKIASILSTYDTLIENNTKRIRLLEQMAENLYKEWFVRFRFPGHENVEMENGLPKGWKKVSAEERYDITIGKTPPRKESHWFTADNADGTNWVSISDMKDTFISNTKEQLTKDAVDKFNMVVLPKRTIILSFKLTVGRVAIVGEPSCTNEAIAHFKSVSKEEYEYLYLYLKHFEYGNLGNTSAIGNAINSKIVKKMDIVIPEQYILAKFHNIAQRMIERINSLQHQSTLLIRQRDLLLPRLMSGKLEVTL